MQNRVFQSNYWQGIKERNYPSKLSTNRDKEF